jgi:hypothetical protein
LVEKFGRKAAQWRKYGLVAGEVIFVGSKLVFQYPILGMDFQLFSDTAHVGLGPDTISRTRSTSISEGGRFDSKRWGTVDGGGQGMTCDLA